MSGTVLFYWLPAGNECPAVRNHTCPFQRTWILYVPSGMSGRGTSRWEILFILILSHFISSKTFSHSNVNRDSNPQYFSLLFLTWNKPLIYLNGFGYRQPNYIVLEMYLYNYVFEDLF